MGRRPAGGSLALGAWSSDGGPVVRPGHEPDVGAVSRELRLLWIIEEVRRQRIGAGKGAELAEMPRAAFMRILGEHGVPVIDYSIDDLDRELRVLGLG